MQYSKEFTFTLQLPTHCNRNLFLITTLVKFDPTDHGSYEKDNQLSGIKKNF